MVLDRPSSRGVCFWDLSRLGSVSGDSWVIQLWSKLSRSGESGCCFCVAADADDGDDADDADDDDAAADEEDIGMDMLRLKADAKMG